MTKKQRSPQKIIDWLPRIRRVIAQQSLTHTKFEETTLTPNLRALRLSADVAEVLLTMGVSSNSVVSTTLHITETYCSRPAHIDIISNLVMISQLRGVNHEPLTLIRTVTPKDSNNNTIQEVQRLVVDIRQNGLPLLDAETRFAAIMKHQITYPWWLRMIGTGLVPAGSALMFTSDWRTILLTFIISLGLERLLHVLSKNAVPTFFQQAIAASAVTIIAAGIAVLSERGVPGMQGLSPSLIVAGSITLLLAGMAIFNAIKNAIDEYYVTALAHVLKVFMLTSGIAIGVVISLYASRTLGYQVSVSTQGITFGDLHAQIVGGMVLSAGYAITTHTPLRAIIGASLISMGGVTISFMLRASDMSPIAASGVAAIFIGYMAATLARALRTPSTGIAAIGIIPLVPGFTLYNGLVDLMNYSSTNGNILSSVGTLFTALSIAFTLAAGASFGSMLGQPFKHKITLQRNSRHLPENQTSTPIDRTYTEA